MSLAGYRYPIWEYLELLLFEMDTTKCKHATEHKNKTKRQQQTPNKKQRGKENWLVSLVLNCHLEDEWLYPAGS